jgi:hypothetical protein
MKGWRVNYMDNKYFGIYYFLLFVKSINKNNQLHFFQKINNIILILLHNIKIYYGIKVFIMPCEKRKLTENIIKSINMLKIKDEKIDDFIIGVIIYYFLLNKFEGMIINLYCLFDYDLQQKKCIINIVNDITLSNKIYASFIRRFSLGLHELNFFEIL